MKKLILSAMMFLPMLANAGDAVVSWDPPIEYEDGTAIQAGEITNYKIYYGQTSGGPYQFSVSIDGSVTTATITGLAKGDWFFVATATTINGLESVYSNEAAKTVRGTSKPKPPRNVR